ncbi:MAG: hypothetical protein CVU99_01795 [Firmicutes bacterium HGW-Firmicutes-4]|jgi:hypothetical protein|nr:MAG: hypothetical protein CVU99_01795 [Firmicutes bacterium HGW-Firmicutes-4]
MKDDEFVTITPNQKAKSPETADKSQDFGLIGLVVMFIILLGYNLYKGLPISDLNAMFWGYLGMSFVIKYQRERITSNLIVAIGGIVASLSALANYILTTW